ncbi:MAG: DUF815 domain-containing protein [Rickettsiales bacterium]
MTICHSIVMIPATFLKSVLEGGGEGKPDNVLFYATSNRRHLMPP